MESPKEEIVTKEISCPVRRREIVKRRNRVDVESLRILKRKAYEIEMETSGPKGQWRSKMDQR